MLVYCTNLKKMESYFRVNFLGPDPRLMKKKIYRAAVSQGLRNTGLGLTAMKTRPGRFRKIISAIEFWGRISLSKWCHHCLLIWSF